MSLELSPEAGPRIYERSETSLWKRPEESILLDPHHLHLELLKRPFLKLYMYSEFL